MNRNDTRSGQDEENRSFDDRLKDARKRQGLEKPETASAASAQADAGLGIVLRAGTEMVSALAVGVAIGLGLDRWLGTKVVFLILFAFLGGAAGVLNVWRLVKP